MAKKRSVPSKSKLAWCVGTTKGAFLLRSKQGKAKCEIDGPFQFGAGVNDFQQDPRDRKRFLMTVGGGHLGPTIMLSENGGKKWREAKLPPRFHPQNGKQDPESTRGKTVKRNFWLTPGHDSQPGTWYLGTVPQGLFVSRDHGDTWEGVDGFNLHPSYAAWTKLDDPPDGPFLHSVLVDPRDAERMWISMSCGGTFESADAGASWRPINRGVESDFNPGEDLEYGQDPHCVIQHPGNPDVLYQQNHCGIYRLNRAEGERWTRIGKNMPKRVGDIGFGIAGHPRDAGCVWVFPMDGTSIWPRTSPGGKPAVYRTENRGKKWTRLDAGLPGEQAWFTVYRQGLACAGDAKRPAVAFGTSSGEVWIGLDGGERFRRLAAHLPKIQSLRPARV